MDVALALQIIEKYKQELKLDEEELTVEEYWEACEDDEEDNPQTFDKFMKFYHSATLQDLHSNVLAIDNDIQQATIVPRMQVQQHFEPISSDWTEQSPQMPTQPTSSSLFDLVLVKTTELDGLHERFVNNIMRYEQQCHERGIRFTMSQRNFKKLFSSDSSWFPYGFKKTEKDQTVVEAIWDYMFRNRLGARAIENFRNCRTIFPSMISQLSIAVDFMEFVRDGLNGRSRVNFLIRTQFNGQERKWWPRSYQFTSIGSLTGRFNGSWKEVFNAITSSEEFGEPFVCLIQIKNRDIMNGDIEIHRMTREEFRISVFAREGQSNALKYSFTDFVWLHGRAEEHDLPSQAFLGFGGRRTRLESFEGLINLFERFAHQPNLFRSQWEFRTAMLDSRGVAMDMSDVSPEWFKFEVFFRRR